LSGLLLLTPGDVGGELDESSVTSHELGKMMGAGVLITDGS
jgi:hypothetical protein